MIPVSYKLSICANLTYSFRNPGQKDEFDSLLDKAPENINYIKRSLLQFSNSILGKFNIIVANLSDDFSNGVNLIILIGMVQGKLVCILKLPQFLEKLKNQIDSSFEF